MPEDAPANLNLEHLDAFLLESNEAVHCDMMMSMLIIALFTDYVLNGTDVLGVQLSLEHSLLEGAEVRVG